MSRPAAINSSIERIARARPDGIGLTLERRSGPGEGWFSVEELLSTEGAPAVLLSRIRGMYGVPADHIRAEWLFESYARAIADLGVSFIVAERRLPDLDRKNLLMTSGRGLIVGTAIISENMIALNADPVSHGHGISRVESWQDLAREFRDGLEALVEPLVSWMARHGLRQEKTLWLAAADRTAQSLVWSGRAFDDPGFARELAAEMLGGPGPMAIPLNTGIDSRGSEQHLRTTCCLAYRAAGGGLCFGCPLNR